MNTSKIKVNDLEFLRIELELITQKQKVFYLGKVEVVDILDLFTVRPAEYDLHKHTSLSKIYEGEDDYYSYLINEDKENLQNKDFQREPDGGRLNEVASYIKNEEYAFFPNTIIVTCDLINDFDIFNVSLDNTFSDFISINNRPVNFSFLTTEEERFILYMPCVSQSLLVIDGQHRLRGLAKVDKGIIQKYDLLLSFMIGYDRSVIAKQFYTVNYYQKPVNKSLLYQLTGEFTKEVDEFTFLHYVVKILNELENSPFFGRIKMLGKAPRNISQEERSKYSVSQAFLVDSLLITISKNNTTSIYLPIFYPLFIDKELQPEIIRILARFFNAVKKLRPDWGNPSDSIISKGMGIGALIKVLQLIFPVIFKERLEQSFDNLPKLKVSDFEFYLKGIESVNLDEFSGIGSAGSVNKIKQKIINNLEFYGTKNTYDDYIRLLKESYLDKCRSYLINPLTQVSLVKEK